MHAQVGEHAFSDPDWTFEPKLDGYHGMAYLNDGKARLRTRGGGHDYTPYFPHIIQALEAQPIWQIALDAESLSITAGRRLKHSSGP